FSTRIHLRIAPESPGSRPDRAHRAGTRTDENLPEPLSTLCSRVLISQCAVVEPPARVAGLGSQEVIAVLRFDPFSDLDEWARSMLSTQVGSNRAPRFMPMDLCKIDDHYVLTAD